MCVGAYLSFNTINKTLSYCRASLDILWVLRDGTIIDLITALASPHAHVFSAYVTGIISSR